MPEDKDEYEPDASSKSNVVKKLTLRQKLQEQQAREEGMPSPIQEGRKERGGE